MNGYVILPTNKDLLHHGRLGQKWGERNGPPYPLGMSNAAYKKVQRFANGLQSREDKEVARSARKEARKQKAIVMRDDRRIARKNKQLKKEELRKKQTERQKQKAVEQNSYAKLYAIKDRLTYDEMQKAMNRIELEQKLYAKANPKKPGVMDTIDSLMKTVDQVRGWTDKGIKAYDTICTVYNHQESVRTGKQKAWVPFKGQADNKKNDNKTDNNNDDKKKK